MMFNSEPRVTIIPPNGREITGERRRGDGRLRSYKPSGSYPSKLDRRKSKRSLSAKMAPRRFDLEV